MLLQLKKPGRFLKSPPSVPREERRWWRSRRCQRCSIWSETKTHLNCIAPPNDLLWLMLLHAINRSETRRQGGGRQGELGVCVLVFAKTCFFPVCFRLLPSLSLFRLEDACWSDDQAFLLTLWSQQVCSRHLHDQCHRCMSFSQ